MDSDPIKNNFLFQLNDRADIATQKFNNKIFNSIEALKNQFKTKLNLVSLIVFIIILIILVVFIFLSIYIPTKDVCFTIIQYLTVSILSIILLTFYIINKPLVLKTRSYMDE